MDQMIHNVKVYFKDLEVFVSKGRLKSDRIPDFVVRIPIRFKANIEERWDPKSWNIKAALGYKCQLCTEFFKMSFTCSPCPFSKFEHTGVGGYGCQMWIKCMVSPYRKDSRHAFTTWFKCHLTEPTLWFDKQWAKIVWANRNKQRAQEQLHKLLRAGRRYIEWIKE